MIIRLVGNTWRYEMEKLSMAFFPDRKFQILEPGKPEPEHLDPNQPVITVVRKEDSVTVTYQDEDRKKASVEPLREGTDPELAAGRALYNTLSAVTGLRPKWGILTGVRPSKVMRNHLRTETDKEAISYFENALYVDPKKAALAHTVARAEDVIIADSTPESCSLYISIPFCPNRCTYCSFVSHSIGSPSAKKLFPQYYEKLLQEVERTGEISAECGLTLRSIYIGGGTPSTLSSEQISGLLQCISRSFDLSSCSEFTFEAGRPDTTTAEKLRAIKEGGADRISINPQSMTDDILQSVGRNHTVEDIKRTFREAREAGFQNINMDLIAGLPGDDPENFRRSLMEVLDLDPESVTVHTLAIKRSASLIPTEELFSRGNETSEMVDTSSELLYNNGYAPYYMYRQKYMQGNLENVGYAKPGTECVYNIDMMEETVSIMAHGAGSMTKRVYGVGERVERLPSPKDVPTWYQKQEKLFSEKKRLFSD